MGNTRIKPGYRYGSQQARQADMHAPEEPLSKHASALYTLFDSLCDAHLTCRYVVSGGNTTDDRLGVQVFRHGHSVHVPSLDPALTKLTQLLDEGQIAYEFGPREDGFAQLRLTDPYEVREQKIIALMDQHQAQIMANHKNIDFVLTKPNGTALDPAQELASRAALMEDANAYWEKEPTPSAELLAKKQQLLKEIYAEARFVPQNSADTLQHTQRSQTIPGGLPGWPLGASSFILAARELSGLVQSPTVKSSVAYYTVRHALRDILVPNWKKLTLNSYNQLFHDSNNMATELLDGFCKAMRQANNAPDSKSTQAAFYEAFKQLAHGLPQEFVTRNLLIEQLELLREAEAKQAKATIEKQTVEAIERTATQAPQTASISR